MTITHMGVSKHVAPIKFTFLRPTLLCMAFVSTGIRTPALVVRSQSSCLTITKQQFFLFDDWLLDFETTHLTNQSFLKYIKYKFPQLK